MIWIIGCLLHDRTQAIRSAAIPRRPCIISLSSLPLSHPCPYPNPGELARHFQSIFLPGMASHRSQIAKLHHESSRVRQQGSTAIFQMSFNHQC